MLEMTTTHAEILIGFYKTFYIYHATAIDSWVYIFICHRASYVTEYSASCQFNAL